MKTRLSVAALLVGTLLPYGGGCGWLYRNAKVTGAAYWWNRYYECIGYY